MNVIAGDVAIHPVSFINLVVVAFGKLLKMCLSHMMTE